MRSRTAGKEPERAFGKEGKGRNFGVDETAQPPEDDLRARLCGELPVVSMLHPRQVKTARSLKWVLRRKQSSLPILSSKSLQKNRA